MQLDLQVAIFFFFCQVLRCYRLIRVHIIVTKALQVNGSSEHEPANKYLQNKQEDGGSVSVAPSIANLD